MKVDRTTFEAIVSSVARTMDAQHEGKLELEALYMGELDKFSSASRRNIAVHVINTMRRGFDALDVVDSLDMQLISFPSTGNAPDTGPCRARATVIGPSSNISDFIENEDISHRASSPGISVLRKCRISQINLPEYGMRVNLKTEDPIETSDIEIYRVDNISSYRLKRRYSFKMSDNFQLDVTAVRFAPKNSNSLMYETLLTIPETYEFEIEFVGDIKDASTSESITRELISNFNILLKVIDNSEIALSRSEKNAVMTTYLRLTRLPPPGAFAGPKPVTLEIANVLREEIMPGTTSIMHADPERAYTVTEKADGERRLLIIDGDGYMYTIDDRMGVHAIRRACVANKYRDCILDGEHIMDDDGDPVTFAVFDVYVANGTDVRTLPLADLRGGGSIGKYRRKGDASRLASRIDLMDAIVSDITGNEEGTVAAKTFYVADTYTSVCDHARTIMDKSNAGLFPYDIDGLIFTPADLAVGAQWTQPRTVPISMAGKTWSEVLKWKPPDQSSIDFLVRFTNTEASASDTKRMMEGGEPYVSVTLLVGFNVASDLVSDVRNLRSFLLSHKGDDAARRRPEKTRLKYEARPFAFMDASPEEQLHKAYLPVVPARSTPSVEGSPVCANGDKIMDNTIVEFYYVRGDNPAHSPFNWKPMRVRYDKTEAQFHGKVQAGSSGLRVTANSYATAMNVWRTIINPVSEDVITGVKQLDEVAVKGSLLGSVYYAARIKSNEGGSVGMRKFHNFVKGYLISQFSGNGPRIFDFGVGKAGDLHKWIDVRSPRVVGIDRFESNLTDPENGAYSRIVSTRRAVTRGGKVTTIPDIVLFPFDASEPLYSPSSIDNIECGDETTKRIVRSVLLGYTAKTAPTPASGDIDIGALLSTYSNFSRPGSFDLATCMFAIHYFFESEKKLRGFCKNVADVLKPGGFFVGVCPDGDTVEAILDDRAPSPGDSIEGTSEGGDLLWRITRRFKNVGDNYKPKDATIFSKGIDVFMETIGQSIPEFLMHYKTLVRFMSDEGMHPLDSPQLSSSNLGSMSTGLLDGIFSKVQGGEIGSETLRGFVSAMSDAEKEYSFMNRWFVFTKIQKKI
jgi:SAM-dependent methyltransferase